MDPTEQKQNNTNEEEHSDNSAPINTGHLEQNDPIITKDQLEYEKKYKLSFRRKVNRTEKIQIFLTLFNLLTLIVFIIVSSFQISHSIKALDYADSTNVHTRESIIISKTSSEKSDSLSKESLILTGESLDISNKSLGITRQSIENAEKNAKIDLRPYIVVNSDSVMYPFSKVNKNLSMIFSVTNAGKTPAFNFFHTNVLTVIDSVNQSDIDGLIKQSTRHHNAGFALGSNLTNKKEGIYGIFSLQDSINVYNGKNKLIFFGVISYSDIFKERHLTWYCLEYDIKRERWVYNERYNGME
ncbi:MAG: hypothetical protein M0P61_16200 [Ignavibacteriaceae bacterium]|jgi:hypothetical protein|nr:hypothetical protein [Ignavibacteriaceae bacterium]